MTKRCHEKAISARSHQENAILNLRHITLLYTRHRDKNVSLCVSKGCYRCEEVTCQGLMAGAATHGQKGSQQESTKGRYSTVAVSIHQAQNDVPCFTNVSVGNIHNIIS